MNRKADKDKNMEKKFERLSWTEIGIISFMGLVLLIGLVASWHNKSRTSSSSSAITQQVTTKEKSVDTLDQVAEDAVIVLEGTHTEEKLLTAQSAVDKLRDASKKEVLQKRIDRVKELVGQQTAEQTQAKLKAELAKAEAVKKMAEQRKTVESGTSQSTAASEKETRRRTSYSAPVQNTYRGQSSSVTTVSQSPTSSSSTESSVVVEPSETAPTEESASSSASAEVETTPKVSETSESEQPTDPGLTPENPQ